MSANGGVFVAVQAKRRAKHVREGELRIQRGEDAMQAGALLGWPWGKDKFAEAEALMAEARVEFDAAGEAGVEEDTGIPKFMNSRLRKV